MSTELVLPSSVRPDTWNADTAAMMEFAGLTWIEKQGENSVRVFAPSGIMAAFISACQRTGLDPTAKQIYAALMGGKWTILVGIDGMRLVAQRTGEYDGQDPIEWQMEEGGLWSTTPGKGAPYAARVSIYRKSVSRPISQTVTFAEFGGTNGNWKSRPAHMLGIRAESHAYRRMFPQDLSGLYTAEDFETDVIELTESEPSEDWAAEIDKCKTKDAVTAVVDRAKEAGEFTDKVRTLALTRFGMLNRAEPEPEREQTEPSEPEAEEVLPAEPSEEEYERIAAEEFAAAVESGEVQP